jgi:AAA+ ATPase superfamily predicted ATPase
MKFYDRKEELESLERGRVRSLETGGFTVLVGRRRVGKTALVLESLKKQYAGFKQKYLYLFVARQSEALLCSRFQEEAAASLGLTIFGSVNRFRDLFEQLLLFAEKEPYTLVIDEFQELERVNPAIFSEIQDLWDRHKNRVKINFIASGSIYSMMTRIFEHEKEPLFGRQTARLHLQPFKIGVIKKILKDNNPAYTAEDLLCLYMLSGGIPKYLELLVDSGAVNAEAMLGLVTGADSPFINEGKELLVSEFGRDYGVYFSILQLIASGKNSQREIDSIIGRNTGAYLVNLEQDYSVLTKIKPLFSKPGSRNNRWKIADQYLRFWFRFIYPNQSLVETGQTGLLLKLVKKNYPQYSGLVLEDYFRAKTAGESPVTAIGSYWDGKGDNEIDLVALNELEKIALIAEVKRNPKKIDLSILKLKAEKILPELKGYKVQYRALSMEDM